MGPAADSEAGGGSQALCEEFCPDRLTKKSPLSPPAGRLQMIPARVPQKLPLGRIDAAPTLRDMTRKGGTKRQWPRLPCRGGWGRGSLVNHSALGSCRASQGLSDPLGRRQGPSGKFSFTSSSPCFLFLQAWSGGFLWSCMELIS